MYTVSIYGLGAIGSNLLVQLAKQYPDYYFQGIDFDKVEERNIRTQAYYLEHVGLYKSEAMRIILARHIRKPKYTSFRKKVENNETDKIFIEDEKETSLIIDCFDNTESRKAFEGVPSNILHVGFSPHYTAECIWNEEYEVPNDVDPKAGDICSMPDAVGFINFVVSSAVLNISQWIQTKKKKSFIVTGKNKVKWL